MAARTIITLDNPHGFFAGLALPPAFRKRIQETRFRQEWRLDRLLYDCLMLGWNGGGDARQFMQRFRGPKFQRGMLAGFGRKRGTAGSGSSGSVVLTAHTIIDLFNTPATRAGVRFDTDGGLTGTRLQLADEDFSGEWWSDHPQPSVGDDYAVRALAAGATGTWTSAAAADDTWITMTANRWWYVEETSTSGQTSAARTFEVGPQPSGPADDSATITCTADVSGV